jgi:hypothetical protein
MAKPSKQLSSQSHMASTILQKATSATNALKVSFVVLNSCLKCADCFPCIYLQSDTASVKTTVKKGAAAIAQPFKKVKNAISIHSKSSSASH